MRTVISTNTSFLGNRICWYQHGFWGGPKPLALKPQGAEMYGDNTNLDELITWSRRMQRQYDKMRTRLATTSIGWSGAFRYANGSRGDEGILAHVIVENSGSAAAALLTSNEDGKPTTHLTVVIPCHKLELPLKLPVIAERSLKTNQIQALRARAVLLGGGDSSAAFTFTIEPRLSPHYPHTTYDLDVLLTREMLHWMDYLHGRERAKVA